MELMEPGKACSRSGEAGVEWLTPEQRSKRREQRHVLFAEGREVASDPCERGRADVGAEAAGNLLLDFEHAQVAFGLVVVERNSEII